MIHCDPVILEESVDDLEIIDEIAKTDMFEHADAGDPVELSGYIPVILDADIDFVFQTFFPDALACQFILVFGKSDTDDTGTEFFRRPDGERSPTATDVQ